MKPNQKRILKTTARRTKRSLRQEERVVRVRYFYGLVPIGCVAEQYMHVMQLATTKRQAIILHEHWNDGEKMTPKRMKLEGLEMQRFLIQSAP